MTTFWSHFPSKIIYLELSPPAEEHIARELYRGSYRSRGPVRGVLGGSWRYIAGGLCRGGEAEEGEEEGGKEGDGRTLRNLTTPHRVVGNNN